MRMKCGHSFKRSEDTDKHYDACKQPTNSEFYVDRAAWQLKHWIDVAYINIHTSPVKTKEMKKILISGSIKQTVTFPPY